MLTELSAEAWEVFLTFTYQARGDAVAEPDAFPLTLTTARATAEGTPTTAPPNAPRNFRAIPGDKKITLLWDPPAFWGGWEPGGYQIQYYCEICGGTLWWGVRTAEASSTSNVLVPKLVQNREGLVVNGRASKLRIRAWSKKPGTDGAEDGTYLYGGFSAEISVDAGGGAA